MLASRLLPVCYNLLCAHADSRGNQLMAAMPNTPRRLNLPGSISVNDEPYSFFNSSDIGVLTDGLKRDADRDVEEIDQDTLLNTPVDDTVQSIVERRSIDVPRFRRDDAYMLDPIETKFKRRDYGHRIDAAATLLVLIVPFDGDASLFRYKPTSHDTAPPRGNLQ